MNQEARPSGATVTLVDRLEAGGPDATAVWRILKAVDGEFVPALSSRRGPSDTELSSPAAAPDEAGPKAYFAEILQHKLLTLNAEGRIVGLLAFRERYVVRETGALCGAYVSNIAVLQAWRGRGYARALYTSLIAYVRESDLQPKTIATRTWSTNTHHIALLQDLGFVLTGSVPNGRGEGVDTVVYALDLS